MATATGSATASITGGWASVGGDWSDPVRLTGDNGLMGKIMRGVNEFSSSGLTDGRPDGQGGYVNGYQGRDETDPSIVYYDVVFVKDVNQQLSQDADKIWYFYCKNGVGAKDINPITDVVTNDATYKLSGTKWQRAENYDFIATNVLLAENAFIDVLSGNGVYMYNDSGSSSADVVAGIQGGSTVIYQGSSTKQVNFFAGGSNPQTAPFRVYYDGSFVFTAGMVGPFTLNQYGLEVSWTDSGGAQHESHYGTDILRQSYTDSNNRESTTYLAALTGLELEGYRYDGNGSGVSITGTSSSRQTFMDARGYYVYNGNDSSYMTATELVRNGENAITSVDGNILHVRKLTQAQYEALTSTDSYTLYIIV